MTEAVGEQIDNGQAAQNALRAGTSPLGAKTLDIDGVERAVSALLLSLGQGEKAEVMQNTPRRVAELYAECINPGYVDIEADFKLFENPGVNDLIIVNDVHYVSVCEHHLAPAFGVGHLAYIPDQYIVGYSKLKKALNYLARQPQLNERLVVDSLDFVEARLAPKGIGLILRSAHCCIALRSNAPMQELVTVSAIRGALKNEPYRTTFWQSALANKPLFLGQ
jgi:GTP cyclohydrolase I